MRDAGSLDFISSVLIFGKHRVYQEELPCWPQLTVIILWPLFLAVAFISKYFAVCGLGRMSHGMSRKVPRLRKSRLTLLEVLFPKVGPRGLSRSWAPCAWARRARRDSHALRSVTQTQALHSGFTPPSATSQLRAIGQVALPLCLSFPSCSMGMAVPCGIVGV